MVARKRNEAGLNVRDMAVRTATSLENHIEECGRNYARLLESIVDLKHRSETLAKERRTALNRIMIGIGLTFFGTIVASLRSHGLL